MQISRESSCAEQVLKGGPKIWVIGVRGEKSITATSIDDVIEEVGKFLTAGHRTIAIEKTGFSRRASS